MTLQDLDLSVRAYNCLTKRGILTSQSGIEEILLLQAPSAMLNLGLKTYREIIQVMAQEFTVDKIKLSPLWTTAPDPWKVDYNGRSIL